MAIIECPHCGETLRVDGDKVVRFGHADAAGIGREWVIYNSRGVLHRCAERTNAPSRIGGTLLPFSVHRRHPSRDGRDQLVE